MKYIKHIFFEHLSKAAVIFGVLVVLAFYSFIYANAADAPLPFTLNPGHPWNETGDGNIQFTGTTALRTFTLPDASATLLTTTATTADITASTDKNYVTDAQKTVIQNTSGANSGDDAVNSNYSGFATSKQDTLVSGGNLRTINGNSLLGGTNLVIASGSGDVVGPASATDNNFVSFDTTTGKLIKDSGFNSSSFLTSLSGALLATGATTGATSQSQTFTKGIILGAGSASIAPLTLTSGTLLTTTSAGAIEFNNDNYYGTITTGAGSTYVSDYPPAQNGTYVNANFYSSGYESFNATDPTKSLTGLASGNEWYVQVPTNQRFHIDLGSTKVITQIYYENHHSNGGDQTRDAHSFTFWGSNNAGAFADLTYGDDTNWIQLSTSQLIFDQHSASDAPDPRYITVTNSTAYRYYAFKFADNYGGDGIALRRLELQEGISARKTFVMTNNGDLVSGRIPFATTNGRLIDTAGLAFDGTNLTAPAFVTTGGTSSQFVKGDGSLDSSSYISSLSGAVLTNQSVPQTIGDTTNRLAKLWASDLTSTTGSFDTSVMSPVLLGGTGTSSSLILQSTSGAGDSSSIIKFLTGDNGAVENARMGVLIVGSAAATGGTITTSGGYTIHTFTSNGTFTPTGAVTSVDYLIVGGGGGGGGGSNGDDPAGGGGGGGGLLTGTTSVTATPYSIVVGSGGAGGATGINPGHPGANGNNSSFDSLISYGGGGGGSYNTDMSGLSGGSGGGATYVGTNGSGTGGQGHDGGLGLHPSPYNAGGGGGASAIGQDGSGSNGGNGGDGSSSSISGSAVVYAGGGGGGGGDGSNGGTGGTGGGSNGSTNANSTNDATANTGGGGGGGSTSLSGASAGGNGGSGIVIIRYLTPGSLYSPVFGIGGVTSPTALLHLGAGTANASTAPLKFTAGTNLTTPEAGAMEWDGTNLFVTQTSGPTRKTLAYTSDIPSLSGVVLADGTVTGATSQSQSFTKGIILGAGTASIAPLTFTSGTLLTTTSAGAMEFNNDNYYGTITTGAGVSIIYTSDYPPAQNGTYVKATTMYSSNFEPYFATDPANSMTGDWTNNAWASQNLAITNQRFHIDLGSTKTITKFYYENGHTYGAGVISGVKDFTLWGSNDAGAFADLTYGDDTNWTQLSTSQLFFDQHIASDVADPKYIMVTNSTAYRYYAFKFANNWGDTSYITLRRLELQEGNSISARKTFVMTDNGNLTAGRIPFATTNGRLIDSSGLLFDGSNLQIGGNAVRGTTAGTNQLVIFDGTAPAGTLTNGGSIFSAAGELHVMDAIGNNTQISPHDAITNFWVYDSVNLGLGKSLKIDMEEIMKALNAEFGLDYVHECLDNGSGGCLPNTNMDPTIADKFTTSIKGTLGKLGLFVEDGIATVKEMYADKLTSKQLCLTGNDGETVCIDKNQLKNVFGASVVTPTTPPATPPPTPPADTTPPVISLVGAEPMNLAIGDAFTDPGATALDDIDGDITANISAINNVDTSTAGTYTITYTVKDVAGNMGTATRTVVVN